MDKAGLKNKLPRSMANVYKHTAWLIECVVPAVAVHIFLSLLNPPEHFIDCFEFELSVLQFDSF